jgi:hypothetical protein
MMRWGKLAALLLAGCAGTPVAIAPRFNGVWVTDTGSPSWVEIQAHSVVSFGLMPSNGHCAATSIDIVAQDRVNVPVSPLGNGPMSFKVDRGVLLIAGKYATMRFVPSARESICRVGGSYAHGAPYPTTK